MDKVMTPIEPEEGHPLARLIIFWIIVILIAVVTTVNLSLVLQVRDNTNISTASTCVLIRFLDASAVRQQVIIDSTPNPPEQLRDGVVQTRKLADALRSTGVECATLPQGG